MNKFPLASIAFGSWIGLSNLANMKNQPIKQEDLPYVVVTSCIMKPIAYSTTFPLSGAWIAYDYLFSSKYNFYRHMVANSTCGITYLNDAFKKSCED